MRPPAVPLLTRAALALYPPSWRARYGDEVRALLEDSGSSPAAVASVAWRALPAWFWPPRHLHDRPARMRASLATALMSWSMLAGLGLVFAQLTQLQGLTAPGHPEIRWAYAVFDVTPGHLGAGRRASAGCRCGCSCCAGPGASSAPATRCTCSCR